MSALRIAALACAALLAAGPPASGHVVYERTSLRTWLQRSDAALLARIESGPRAWTSPDGRARGDFFAATTLESLRGAVPPERFDFLPHAEGLPGWKPGDRVLLFLERSSDHPELARSASRFEWVSTQGPRAPWIVPAGDPQSAAVLEQARSWSRWLDAPPTAEPRTASLRTLLLGQLRSPSSVLQVDALRELIRAADADLLFPDAAAVHPFAELAAGSHLDVAHRVTLGRLLAGQPGFDAGAWWTGLLSGLTSDAERRAVLRKMGGVRDAGARAWMIEQLGASDAGLRREAAWAVGRLGPERPVAALAGAAADPDPGVARAAIRALGAGSEPSARRALEAIAAGSDPQRAAWARAELRRGAAAP